MASKIKEFYHRYLYSDELALEVRLVNLVYVVGSMTALAATVFRALVFSSLSLTLVMVTCTVIPIILIYVSNRTKRYRLLNWITVVAFADVLFPLSFFFVGGVDGGMAAYFVLSVVAIFILTKGRQFAVMLITHVACMIGCYYLSFRYPNLTAAFTARQQYSDTIQSILLVGCCIGLLVRFQTQLFAEEKQKAGSAQIALARRDELMSVVNDAAAILFEPCEDDEDFENVFSRGLAMIADSVKVNRIRIWKTHKRAGKSGYTELYVWQRDADGSPQHKSGWSQDAMTFSFEESMPEWNDALSGGRYINTTRSSFTERERERLGSFGILSLLVIPVFLREKFWGFISFDDCAREREFPDEDVDVLRSGSLLFVNAIERYEMMKLTRDADERARIMLNATPLCCHLWNRNAEVIDCNTEALRMFHLPVEEYNRREYCPRFFEFSPECQPNGVRSVIMARQHIRYAFQTGYHVFEWMHQTVEKEQIPTEVTLVRVQARDDEIVVGYTRDLREYRLMMENIDKQEAMLRTINEAASILLNSGISRFRQDLWQCFGMMAAEIDVDRIYVWKNQKRDGRLISSRVYEWSKDMEPNRGGTVGFEIPFDENVPGWWEGALSAGRCVNGAVRNFSEAAQSILAPRGILSILVVPVFLQNTFWGYVGFDDCHNEREFSIDEESIMRSASMLIANAMQRNDSEMLLASRLRQQELMAEVSQRFISDEPIAELIHDALRRVGEFLGVTRILIAVADSETGQSRVRYLWRGKDDVSAAPVVSRHVDAAERRFPKTLPPTGFVPAICCGDIRKEGQCGILENAGLTAFIRAPLYVGGRYWGMLSAEEIFSTRQWSESDVQLVGMIASTIAGAVARDLYEKERAEALDQAVKASKAKGDFLSNMSHEMRTPMNAIIGMTAIGRAATEVERKDYAFAKIDDASVHLLGVINDILDMSKIEANRLELSPTEFNFERMLQKVVNVVNFKVEEKRQHFYVDVDAAIPQTLVGDDQRLSQVIANLLSNAVKFTPEGGSIRLAADVDAAERDFFTLRIAVTDTGIGISEEQQARLFNSFEQADTGTSRKFGGTGLGLAISKRIVEMMGGTIRIESTLGEGATFLFTVRMERGRDAPCEDLLAPDVNWGNIRVLAVDDERETLDYFTRVANRLGIACDVAASGEDACRLIERNGRYDVYFVDWRMPGMDGIELARRIRVLSAGKSVVTMISAAERGQIEGEARDAGVNLFLPKPLLPSSIADCINECLGVSRATAGAGGAGGGANAAGGGADGTGETAGHAVDFSGRRVLLAEDVEVNREIVLALLASTRLEIECAENGAEALRMFTESPDRYDMIFMDVQMPEMDGYEATKRIRALGAAVPRAKVIPIVAMTANVFREDIEKCLMAGMDDHVGKPLDFSDVQNKLEKYLVGIKDEIPQ